MDFWIDSSDEGLIGHELVMDSFGRSFLNFVGKNWLLVVLDTTSCVRLACNFTAEAVNNSCYKG